MPGKTLRARGAVSTEPVLRSPSAPLSRQWLGESTEGQEAIRVCSYNVLAEIYATAHTYPYCPRWALDGGYRCSLVVQELVDADADVICLQEAQRDAFENFLEPFMKRAGYEALFTQKSREAMGAAGKVDALLAAAPATAVDDTLQLTDADLGALRVAATLALQGA